QQEPAGARQPFDRQDRDFRREGDRRPGHVEAVLREGIRQQRPHGIAFVRQPRRLAQANAALVEQSANEIGEGGHGGLSRRYLPWSIVRAATAPIIPSSSARQATS